MNNKMLFLYKLVSSVSRTFETRMEKASKTKTKFHNKSFNHDVLIPV